MFHRKNMIYLRIIHPQVSLKAGASGGGARLILKSGEIAKAVALLNMAKEEATIMDATMAMQMFRN